MKTPVTQMESDWKGSKEGPVGNLPLGLPQAGQRCFFKCWCNHSCPGHRVPTHVTPQESGSCLPCGYYRAQLPSSSFPRECVEEPRAWAGRVAEWEDQQASGALALPELPRQDQSEREPVGLPTHLGPTFLESWEKREQGSRRSK